ncbi:uncharacterized [Tachysurus ichikawai]
MPLITLICLLKQIPPLPCSPSCPPCPDLSPPFLLYAHRPTAHTRTISHKMGGALPSPLDLLTFTLFCSSLFHSTEFGHCRRVRPPPPSAAPD